MWPSAAAPVAENPRLGAASSEYMTRRTARDLLLVWFRDFGAVEDCEVEDAPSSGPVRPATLTAPTRRSSLTFLTIPLIRFGVRRGMHAAEGKRV